MMTLKMRDWLGGIEQTVNILFIAPPARQAGGAMR